MHHAFKNFNIKIIKSIELKGPSIWTYVPCLETWVDIGLFEDFPSDAIPGFYERLSGDIPSLVEHRCSPGCRGGFLQRLRSGTWVGHVLEHVTLEFLTQAGLPDGFGRTRGLSSLGCYKMVVTNFDTEITVKAIQYGVEYLLAAAKNLPFNLSTSIGNLSNLVNKKNLGYPYREAWNIAEELKLPISRRSEANPNVFTFGYGKNAKIFDLSMQNCSDFKSQTSSEVRIPIVGILGNAGRCQMVKTLVSHLEIVKPSVCDGFNETQVALNSPCSSLVISSIAPTSILDNGLAYDRCHIGVVLDSKSDSDLSEWDVQPEGSDYFTTPRAIYRTQVDVVLPCGFAVLNADDEIVLGLSSLCDGQVILFAGQKTSEIDLHLANAGRAVYIKNSTVWRDDGIAAPVACVSTLPSVEATLWATELVQDFYN